MMFVSAPLVSMALSFRSAGSVLVVMYLEQAVIPESAPWSAGASLPPPTES